MSIVDPAWGIATPIRDAGGCGVSLAARPVLIDGCAGWLHGVAAARSDVAVLICPPLSWDALYSYHPLRRFADATARLGIPALRLHYPGTGDSLDVAAGSDGAAEPWAAWLAAVDAASAWLLAETGARRLVLLGVRIGATLATLAAEQREDVAGLILLAPVLRGHSYLRQLAVEARMEGGEAASSASGLAFHELEFSAESVRRISAVDLRRAALRADQHVALFAPGEGRLIDECMRAWSARGATVAAGGFDGLEPLLRQNMEGDDKPADFSAVLTWLKDVSAAAPTGLRPARGNHSRGWADLALPGCTETPVQFGAGRLFGVLCQPADGARDLAVIIGNTGRDPHFGIARFGVTFARRLAVAGIASLRLDFAGLGDSPGPPGAEDALSPLFDLPRQADISAAVDLLRQFGWRRFAVQGVCSGAYHALHGAAADPRIETLLLVNCPDLHWQAGDTPEIAARRLATPGLYVRKIFGGDFWQRLCRGDLAFARICRTQIERLAGRGRRLVWDAASRLRLAPPRADAPRETMAALAARGARTLFLFCPGDPGIAAMAGHFGPGAARLRRYRGAEMRIVPGLDHVLSTRAMQAKAANLMIEFLGPARASPGPSLTQSAPGALEDVHS